MIMTMGEGDGGRYGPDKADRQAHGRRLRVRGRGEVGPKEEAVSLRQAQAGGPRGPKDRGGRAQQADTRARAFTMRGLMSSFTGPDADRAAFWKAAGDMGLAMGADGRPLRIPFTGVKNEAFIVPIDVAYVAKGADVSGCTRHSGSWSVLSSALSFDYLWNEVRVKGGAYGTGFRRAATGSARFHSYRDPGIDGTIARFDAAGAWLAEFSSDADEMEGYVVSTTASHDAPVKPRLHNMEKKVTRACIFLS